MKIVHLLKHGAESNGHVHMAVDLACTQADRGHRVWLVQSWGSYSELLTQHGVHVVEVPTPAGVVGSLRSLGAIAALFWKIKPNIAHAHMMSSAIMGFIAAKLTKTPLVATMHNSFNRHSVLMRLGNVVVAVSDAERQLLLSRGYSARRTVYVLNGVSGSPRERSETLDEEESTVGLERPSVMTLSGLHGRKGIDDVLMAFSDLLPTFPEWHLSIVGSGPDREQLEALSESLGLSSRAHFLGSSKNPMSLLKQTDIFVNASLAEPCGLAIAEARSAGAAVVATSVGGTPEILDQGRAGLLVEAQNPDSIAAALRQLMSNEESLQDYRMRSRHGAEYFSVARMASDYDTVYAQALSGAFNWVKLRSTRNPSYDMGSAT